MLATPTAFIDLAALQANYQQLCHHAAPAQVMVMLKANAYGHGAVVVANALQAQCYGVAHLSEAQALRDAGITQPILWLQGMIHQDQWPKVRELQLDLVVHHQQQIDWLSQQTQGQVRCWLKLNTGMNRLGFASNQWRNALSHLQQCSVVGQVILMSHFASADCPEKPTTAKQLQCWHQGTEGITVDQPISLANSAGLLAWPDTHHQWVRLGIALYGLPPVVAKSSLDLTPVMSLQAPIIALHHLSAGQGVGYGHRFICQKPTRLAVIGIGYGDGYPRHAPDGTPVMINGQRCHLAGCVSMDMITVDLGNCPAQIGDVAELWGQQLSVEIVASQCHTISYELLTRVSARVPRQYV